MSKIVKKKQNPMEAAISLIGGNGEGEIPIGKTVFHVVHSDEKLAWIHGKILNESGAIIGSVSIDGIPLDHLPSAKAGRPKEEEKHLAVLLAWALNSARFGGKFTVADEKTAEYFNYSESKKIRDIRNRLAKQYGIDLDKHTLHITDDKSPTREAEASIFITKPTYYLDEFSGLLILGKGFAWHEKLKSNVLQGVMRVEVPVIDSSTDIEGLMSNRGPVIISVIRPGR